MLTFVGLGLYDERSITIRGRDALRAADRVFAERYTSRLAGASMADVEAAHGVDVDVLDRSTVEDAPEPVLAAADTGDAVFLAGGDPMVATTHVDLRLRAADRGIETRVVHGTSAESAASSLTGLQNYRFGKATTLPFPETHGSADDVPASVSETIRDNRDRDLHTLVFLDIEDARDRLLRGSTAAELLHNTLGDRLGVVVGQAGSDSPTVVADRLAVLAERSFGPPLHLLVLPGPLHAMEREALATFAMAPSDVLDAHASA